LDNNYFEASQISKRLKEDNKKIVFTNGCFDIIHAGHIDYLKKASQLGDVLIIGLNSDNSVKRLKGQDRPINNENARRLVLEGIKGVYKVLLFEEDTPAELIDKVRPDILVKGGDYKVDEVVGKDIVEKNGGEVVIIPFLDGYSTTSIIERINRVYGKKR